MDSIDNFLQDIHCQQFYDGTLINPSRFFLIAALLQENKLKRIYSKREIETVIYRYYADNPSLASRHPRVEIRNIIKYGISIIKEELCAALEIWQKEASKNFLIGDLNNIYIDIDDTMDYSADIDYLWMVLDELFKKTYHIKFPCIPPIEGIDTDITIFGKGIYRNHLMEEMQYCVCCDEYDSNKLTAIHIVPDDITKNKNDRESIANGLLMCNEHAQEYLHKRFYFNDNGKIINLSSSLVHSNMRLGRGLLTEKRKHYLTWYMNELQS